MTTQSSKDALAKLLTEVRDLVSKEKARLEEELSALESIQSGSGMEKVRQHVRDSSIANVNSAVASYLR